MTAGPDFGSAIAFRWRNGALQPIAHPSTTQLDHLLGIDRQKAAAVQNTEQFVAGRPANHILLTGSRGTGKSSLVKALLTAFAPHGLRLVEVQPQDAPVAQQTQGFADGVAGQIPPISI